MGYLLKFSSAARPLLFLMIDATDHLAGKTGLSPVVTISKNGGSFGAPSGAVSEVGNGWYQVAGSAADTGTLGPLLLHATASGADPTDVHFEVVAFDPADATRLGLLALPNAGATASGGLPTIGTGSGQVNPVGGNLAVAGYVTGQDPATLLLASPANKLATDASGRVSVGSNADKTGYSLGASQTFNLTGNITGNLTGTVGGVSGAVTVGSLGAGAIGAETFASGAITSAAFAPAAIPAAAVFQVDGLAVDSALTALLAVLAGVTTVTGNQVVFKKQDGTSAKVTVTYGTTAGERTVSLIG